MKQDFIEFFKKKMYRGISLILCVTTVLSMIPMFTMTTGAAQPIFSNTFLFNNTAENMTLNDSSDTYYEYKANTNASNKVSISFSYRSMSPYYDSQVLALIQSGTTTLNYNTDIWTGTTAFNWAKYTVYWKRTDSFGNNSSHNFNLYNDTTVINRGGDILGDGAYHNIYESSGTKRFNGYSTIPPDTDLSSLSVEVLQPKNYDSANCNMDWGYHNALAVVTRNYSGSGTYHPNLIFSTNIPTMVRTAPSVSTIISGQKLSNSTITGGLVCSVAANNYVGYGIGYIFYGNLAGINGAYSWSDPNAVITSSTNAQINFTPVYSNFNNTNTSISIPVRAAVISLNANGGSGGSTSADGWFGSTPANITVPTRVGYAFKGYYSAISGGTQYFDASGVAVKNWDIAADTTLYAQWEGLCTVSNIAAPSAIPTGSKLALTIPTVTGTPTSQGWQYSANGSTGWTNFDPSSKTFSISENGTYLRYYATNDAGPAYSSSVQITVNKYAPAISISAAPTSATYPANVVLSATITGSDSASGKPIKFYDGASYLGTSNTDSTGKASYSVTSPTAVTHSYKAVFDGDSYNSSVSSSTLSFTVSKGTQSAVSYASTSDINKTYGDTAFTLPTVSGGSGTGAYSYRSSNTAVATVSGNTVTITGAGEAIIYVKKLGDANYNDSTEVSVKIKVAPKSVTISGISANNKIYDGNSMASINGTNAVVNGVINGDAVSIDYTNASASFSDAMSTTGKVVSFSGLTLTGSKAGNYTISAQPASVTADITQKPITISGITAKDKIYDGDKSVTLIMPTITTAMGVVTGDNLIANATGLYEDKDAGSDKTVNISGITLGGTDVGNYKLVATGNQSTTTASINRKTITVTPNVLSKNVGQTDPTLTYTCTDPVSEETAGFSGALARIVGETAGNYKVNIGTLSLVNNGAFLIDNYNLELSSSFVNFTIKNVVATTSDYEVKGNDGTWNKSDLSIAPKGDYVKVSTDGINWSNSIILSTEGVASTVGFYLIKADGTITDKATYTYKLDKTAPTGKLTIKSNSWTSFLKTITFGIFFKENVNVSFVADTDISGIAKTEFIKSRTAISEDEIKTSTDWADFSNTSISAADKERFIYYIRLTDNAGNVSYISSYGITFDTTNATITTDYQKGDSSIAFNVADETAGIANVKYKVGTKEEKTATLNESGQFTVSNLEDGKYNVVVTATDNAGNESSFSQAITSRHYVKYMDNTSQIGGTLTVDYGVALTKPADPIKAGYIFDNWYKDSEYNTLWNFASDTITANTIIYAKYTPKLTTTASITQTDVVYGTAVSPNVTCTSTGTQTIEYKVKGANDNTYTTTKPTNAGDYTARVTVAESSLNLATSAYCNFKITEKELIITGLAVNSKAYDGSKNATLNGTPTLSGIVYSDQIVLINGTPSFDDKNVGTAKAINFTNFAISGDAASNYSVTQPSGITANITAKTITVTPNVLSKNVGQIDPTLTYTYTAPISGETACFNGTLDRTAGETASNYKVNIGTLSLANNGTFFKDNYNLELSSTIVNFTIKNVIATTSDYQVTGNDGTWNKTDLTISPKGDYVKISSDRTNWSNSILLCAEGNPSTIDFYLKKADGTTTDKVTYTYKLDKTAPTATISQGENKWSIFLNTITFGLFFKQTQTVTISNEDTNGSGIASTGYYILKVDNNKDDFEGTLEQAKAYTYTTGTHFDIHPEKNVIIFAKIVDNAGNVTYINSQGMVLEETAPVISGITDGETYYTTREVTVKDTNLDKVTVNKQTFTGNTIAGDVDKTYTVVATDKAGNSTSYTVTMKTIASLSTAIDSLLTDNVKSSDKAAIEAVKAAVSSVDITNATQAEKDALNLIADKCNALLAKILTVTGEIQSVTTKLGDTTKTNAKSSDSTRLAEVKAELERLLRTDNLTDSEKFALEQKKIDVENALAKIVDVAKNIIDVKKPVKDITKENVTKEDRTKIERVLDDLQNIHDDYINNLTDTEKSMIEDQIKSTKEILKVIDDVKVVEDLIKNLPNPSDVTKDDAGDVKKVIDEFSKLTDNQKKLIDPALVTKLNDVSNALKKLLLFDAPTGTKIEGVDGTNFDVRTELVVTPIKDTLDKSRMDKFTLGVKIADKGQEIAQLYDIKLLLNGLPVQPDGKVKITLKLTDEQKNYINLQVVYIADDGKVTIIPCKINGTEVSFITDHFSYYGITGTPVKSSDGIDNPKTGNETPIIPYIIIVFLSATVLAVFTKKKKFRVIIK